MAFLLDGLWISRGERWVIKTLTQSGDDLYHLHDSDADLSWRVFQPSQKHPGGSRDHDDLGVSATHVKSTM